MIDIPGAETAAVLIRTATYYGYAGAVFAALFLTLGIGRIDPASRGSYLFRLLLIPAATVFWPFVLWRWAAAARKGGVS